MYQNLLKLNDSSSTHGKKLMFLCLTV